MNRQSVINFQKQKNSTLFPSTYFLQRKTINRIDLGASAVDTGSPSGQQIDKHILAGKGTHFNHDFSKIPVRLNSRNRIQAKFKIGQPDDKYEQEAGRVAEQIMRMPEPRLSSPVGDSSLAKGTIPRGGRIQHACASCSEEYKSAEEENRLVQTTNLCPKCRTQEHGLIQPKPVNPLIQAKSTGDITPEVTPSISAGIQSLQGGGRSLSESERNFFEPRFGANFTNVRVHNDAWAANAAQSVNSHAFTLGHNVVFGASEYSPNSLAGRKLMAHELTHVIQQNRGHHTAGVSITPLVQGCIQRQLIGMGDVQGFADQANRVIRFGHYVEVFGNEIDLRDITPMESPYFDFRADVTGPEPTPAAEELVQVLQTALGSGTTVIRFVHGSGGAIPIRMAGSEAYEQADLVHEIDLDHIDALQTQWELGENAGVTAGTLLVHEVLEAYRMRVLGEQYEEAHPQAEEAERRAASASNVRFVWASSARGRVWIAHYTYADGSRVRTAIYLDRGGVIIRITRTRHLPDGTEQVLEDSGWMD